MGNVKELQAELKRRKQINLAASNFLSDQENGDLYDAYKKLLDESDNGNDDCLAADYITVWQPLENMTVANMIEVIENAIVEDELPEFLQGIDWELLRKQKLTLLNLANDIDNVEKLEHVEGIIVLIDALQDSAVDDYGLDENLVFDLSDEDEEDE